MFFLVLEVFLLVYFTTAVIYLFTFSLAGIFATRKEYLPAIKKNSIALLVPAYKEDDVILHTAKNLSSLNYNKDLFRAFIIADKLKKLTIQKLLSYNNVSVIQVSFDKSTKAKSLNYALNHIDEKYDIAIILDADNLLNENYLNKVNNCYEAGNLVIQTRRVAKNLNGDMAILDGISEQINNHIFRKGHNLLGLSSSFIGSGIVFPFNLLKNHLSRVNAIGGFDRELQLSIVAQKIKITYQEDAIVFDEKVSHKDPFKSQRKRWISSQFVYLKGSFFKSIAELFKGNFDYFNFGILHNVFLPKFLNFGFVIIFFLISLVFSNFYSSHYWYWFVLIILNSLTLLISTPRSFYRLKYIRVLIYLPGTFFNMLLSLLQIKGANKEFIHTKHSMVEVDHQMFNSEDK